MQETRKTLFLRLNSFLKALPLILIMPFAAWAQIGGPKDIKPAPAGEKAVASPAAAVSQQFEKEGMVIDFSIKSTPGDDGKNPGLVAGADAVVSFEVRDKRTGQPVTGLHPNAWISSRASARVPNETECRDKIRTLMGGLLSVRAEVDLNSYVMLTLNHDNTVTFINPQISFNRTKLENIVTLPGPGADWAASKNREFIYVTLPEQSAVAVINTVTRKLVATIPTGEKTKPMRVAPQPDGRYIWVGLDGSPAVAVIDAASNKLAATVKVGAGLHTLAFTDDSRFAFVTNSAADSVSVIDTEKLTNLADIAVGKTPVPIAYSSASRLVYVAAINGETVSVIDPTKLSVVKTIPVKRGVVALRFEPAGRYAFAVNHVDSTLAVIDASTNTIISSAEVVKGPDQIAFSRRYAYVRGTGSERFSLVDLNDVMKNGKIAPVSVQAGRQPASAAPADLGVADMIQATPEGNSVMIANAPDMMLYYYVEGMMAPMGTFQNYKRRARGLMLLDRSLSETAPGVYSLPIKLGGAGRFDVPVVIDQPRLVNCFQLEVAESHAGRRVSTGASTAVEAAFAGNRFKPGEPVSLRFKITDSVTKQAVTGLKDVQVLLFEPPGVWQQRQWADEVGDGVYEIKQAFPQTGLYRVMVKIASRGVSFADLPFTEVPVVQEAQAAEANR
jgi:YVTN family beta-propeller protein